MTAAIALSPCFVVSLSADEAQQGGNSAKKEFVVTAAGKFSAVSEAVSNFGVRVESPAKHFHIAPPFNQAAVKQGTDVAKLGPKNDTPYFKVRFALPIPPDNDTNLNGSILGIDPYVWSHNHSPGLEVLPNGDVLAIYFSARNARGTNESEPAARFIQARLRFGAEEWDMPELFFDSRDFNDQSALLWWDGDTLRFFGGGRENPVPFKLATSTDNGASWTFSLPLLDKPATDLTPQPIANAFRDSNGGIYFAMDGEKDQSFLWCSADNGIHWREMEGRTWGRHSTIVPIDEKTLLSIGGKNAGTNGYSFQNISTNWGESWSDGMQSPFPALGGNQRPCLIRLANGHLCFVSDSYHRKKEKAPDGWQLGEGCFVAISKDNGVTWHFKMLPVTLPHEADRRNGTLGYATVRQGPNGVIHLLATMTEPCLHYEFNEAWVFSDAGAGMEADAAKEVIRSPLQHFAEKYPNGKIRISWSALVAVNGSYVLEGNETSFYANGRKEHEMTYALGRKTGEEIFWAEDGIKLWSWSHDLKKNRSVWTHYWPNGAKRIESNWNTEPEARDLKRSFRGMVADGLAKRWDDRGNLVQTIEFTNGFPLGDLNLAAKNQP